MPTVKELREQAKSYGLKGYSTLKKHDLHLLIYEVRAKTQRERVRRAFETGRFPALREGINNPYKKEQRLRELHQLEEEVTAALWAKTYEQARRRDPLKWFPDNSAQDNSARKFVSDNSAQNSILIL